MARAQSRYVCQSCGAAVLRWEGQCRTCGEWNTLVETVVHERPRARAGTVAPGGASPAPLSQGDDADTATRRPIGHRGARSGARGRPRRGLRRADRWRARASASPRCCCRSRPGVASHSGGNGPLRDRRGVHGSGPASGGQGSGWRRASPGEGHQGRGRDRRGPDRGSGPCRAPRGCWSWTRSRPSPRRNSTGHPARWGRSGRPTLRLHGVSRRRKGIPVVLVGHVTKDGTLAGPKTLEHLVDVVLVDRGRPHRRACGCCARPRTGSAPPRRSGVFEMGERRSRRGRRSGSGVPRRARREPAPGSRRRPGPRGHRGRSWSRSRRSSRRPARRRHAGRRPGVDPNRLALLIAVLGRRAGIGLSRLTTSTRTSPGA